MCVVSRATCEREFALGPSETGAEDPREDRKPRRVVRPRYRMIARDDYSATREKRSRNASKVVEIIRAYQFPVEL